MQALGESITPRFKGAGEIHHGAPDALQIAGRIPLGQCRDFLKTGIGIRPQAPDESYSILGGTFLATDYEGCFYTPVTFIPATSHKAVYCQYNLLR